MSTRYKFITNSAEYFSTSTVEVWIDVFTTEMQNQRLDFLHWHQVTAGHVTKPQHWLYNSAIDYFTGNKQLLNLGILDGFQVTEINNKHYRGQSPAPVGSIILKAIVVFIKL